MISFINNSRKGDYFMLTNSEEQMMQLLWQQEKPLTATEIIGLSDGKTWKDSYVHLLINSLIKKGLIEVKGFVKTTKNYARTFSPSMSREEYAIKRIKSANDYSEEKIPALFSFLISDVSEDTLRIIKEMLDEKLEKFK